MSESVLPATESMEIFVAHGHDVDFRYPTTILRGSDVHNPLAPNLDPTVIGLSAIEVFRPSAVRIRNVLTLDKLSVETFPTKEAGQSFRGHRTRSTEIAIKVRKLRKSEQPNSKSLGERSQGALVGFAHFGPVFSLRGIGRKVHKPPQIRL